jgi:hypothetical protein
MARFLAKMFHCSELDLARLLSTMAIVQETDPEAYRLLRDECVLPVVPVVGTLAASAQDGSIKNCKDAS